MHPALVRHPSPSPSPLSHSQANIIVGPWATTQTLSIENQLKAGVRALDIRVGFVGAEGQKNDNVPDGIAVVHDTHRTTLSLREALETVKKFVSDHPR